MNTTGNVKETLQKLDVHNKWIASYRSLENEPFYLLTTNKIVSSFNAPPDSLILDAGCGDCRRSIKLANKGYNIYAIDFSQEILKQAEINIKNQCIQQRFTIKCEDITSMSIEDNSFQYIVCWGVLTHIPNLEKAIAELCRILKPNGKIIISETNMYSPESIFYYLTSLLRNKQVKIVPAGIEYWSQTSAGPLFIRNANIMHLVNLLKENNVIVKSRYSNELTEIYTKLPYSNMRKTIHKVNGFWFRFIPLPQLALGNIILGEKLPFKPN